MSLWDLYSHRLHFNDRSCIDRSSHMSSLDSTGHDTIFRCRDFTKVEDAWLDMRLIKVYLRLANFVDWGFSRCQFFLSTHVGRCFQTFMLLAQVSCYKVRFWRGYQRALWNVGLLFLRKFVRLCDHFWRRAIGAIHRAFHLLLILQSCIFKRHLLSCQSSLQDWAMPLIAELVLDQTCLWRS